MCWGHYGVGIPESGKPLKHRAFTKVQATQIIRRCSNKEEGQARVDQEWDGGRETSLFWPLYTALEARRSQSHTLGDNLLPFPLYRGCHQVLGLGLLRKGQLQNQGFFVWHFLPLHPEKLTPLQSQNLPTSISLQACCRLPHKQSHKSHPRAQHLDGVKLRSSTYNLVSCPKSISLVTQRMISSHKTKTPLG